MSPEELKTKVLEARLPAAGEEGGDQMKTVSDDALRQRVQRALVSLGDSADKVAESLRKKRVKGMVLNPIHCPLSNYLKKRGFAGEISVFSETAYVRKCRVWLPDACTNFVSAFDDGSYKDLEL